MKENGKSQAGFSWECRMKTELLDDADYKKWVISIKRQIRTSQIKASIAVNEEMLLLYWDIGKDICEKHFDSQYGSGFFENLSKDLKSDFPEIQGFSVTNLKYMKRFFLFYKEIRHQLGDEFECDMLFYHLKLRRYIVVELKVVKFEPEFVSKLNFYCNAVNHLIKTGEDKNSIGLLICKEKNDVVAQWTVENANEPIGISTYDLKNVLPSEKLIAETISNVQVGISN